MSTSTAHLHTGDGSHRGEQRMMNNDNAATTAGNVEPKQKKKKKKLRPKLKPLSSTEYPELTPTSQGGDDFGFGNFMPTPTRADDNPTTAGNTTAALNAPSSDTTTMTRLNNNNNYIPNNNRPTSPIIVGNTTCTPPKLKLKQRPSLEKRASVKLRPVRSTPSPTRSSGDDAPHTPDDDDYDAFGFGLVKTNSNEKDEGKMSSSSLTSFDATANNNPSVIDNNNNNNSGQRGGRTTTPKNGKRMPSPLSLRRILSSESYFSDDSSTSEESALFLQPLRRDLTKEGNMDGSGSGSTGLVPSQSPRRIPDNNSSGPTQTTDPARRASSSVSFAASAFQTSRSNGSLSVDENDAVHMIGGSYHRGGLRHDASFSSSSDSSLDMDSSVGGDSPYFDGGGSRAMMPQSQYDDQQPLKRMYGNNDPHSYPKSLLPKSQGGRPATSPPRTPPMLDRSNSMPHPPADNGAPNPNPSLSAKNDDAPGSGRVLQRASFAEGSIDSEQGWEDNNQRFKRKGSANSGNDDGSPPTRQTDTPYSHASSVDDPVIARELSAYSLSRDPTHASSSAEPSPFGRRPHAPLDDGRPSIDDDDTDTPTPVRSFYASPRSAMLAASAQSTPRPLASANHDSSFLSNLRDGWMGGTAGGSVASASGATTTFDGSFAGTASPLTGSPRGAFVVSEAEFSPEPPRGGGDADASWKSSSTHAHAYTPHSVSHSREQSLAYSDEEDNHFRRTTAGRRRLLNAEEGGMAGAKGDGEDATTFSSRWIMLFYVLALNLLGGWTCFSVAPISTMTGDALGVADPENLVAAFLAATVLGTACEPAILGRIGLRRTVLFGALLLMLGNLVKSGAGVSETDRSDYGDWRVYLGFVLAGMSQPFYRCTAAFVVVAWFPERERAFATSAALNGHPLGIGCAFVAGALLVETGEDVPAYFHLLSVVSMAVFAGAAMQLEDAPPSPPTEGAARVIRGTVERHIVMEQRVPRHDNNIASQGTATTASKSEDYSLGASRPSGPRVQVPKARRTAGAHWQSPSNNNANATQRKYWQGNHAAADFGSGGSSSRAPLLPSPASFGSSVETQPSPSAFDGPTELVLDHSNAANNDIAEEYVPLNRVPLSSTIRGSYGSTATDASLVGHRFVTSISSNPNSAKLPESSHNEDDANVSPFPNLGGDDHAVLAPRGEVTTIMPALPALEYYNFFQRQFHQPKDWLLPPPVEGDEGAEPIVTQTPRQLDIDVHGDQLWRSLRACFARKGFSHCLLAFAVAGIARNALMAFMEELVLLDGDGTSPAREHHYYVGIVGAMFQLVLVISSIMCGRRTTDEIRKHQFIIVAILALSGLSLAYCNANLDSGGEQLWLNLLMVAVFVGPLQPLSTELGAKATHPLSENTVFVNQQLFSNLMGAASIPTFKVLRDMSFISTVPFAHSFYFLVSIHAVTMFYFGTFDVLLSSHRGEDEQCEKIMKQSEQMTQNTPLPEDPEIGNVSYQPKQKQPPIPREDQPWGKKYPFLIPSSSAIPNLPGGV